MKSLNAKKIAAVVTGAALLGVGLAFAGPVTFQNVPIISNSGQPVVQIVIGSSAKAADGVSAANIAAAIGNLAYTSVPVTASVNATQANSVLKVSVTSSNYSLSNQQVWLNESSTAAIAGSYSFSALIGSVLNNGVSLGTYQYTKTLQGAGQYAYPHSTSISISPVASPYTTSGQPSTTTSVTASTNGGGVSFTSFTTASNDNIMQVTHSNLNALVSNQGANGESESLWLTGFPVFDQESSVNGFALLDAAGAYQITFSKPVQLHSGAWDSANIQTNLNVPITLLGQNWTIIEGYGAGTAAVSSTNTIAGGKLELASSLTPMQTVYVGKNVTSGAFTVLLQDLGQATSAGVSPASLSVYYNGALTNTSSVFPGNTVQFNVTGHNIFVKVNQTFAGLYAYQKWAKMQVFSNVFNVTNGKQFNKTSNPGWYANLLWTNTSSTSNANAVALQSIILYNATPTMLQPGQSFSFIQSPSSYKLTFVGDTAGSANFDSVTATTSTASTVDYENKGSTAPFGLSITDITEPVQELTVTSQIPNAFTYAGQTSASVVFALTPYELNEFGNTVNTATINTVAGAAVNTVNFVYSGTNALIDGANFISATNPLVVTISGYSAASGGSVTSASYTFTSNIGKQALSANLYNVTAIKLNRALPGALAVNVFGGPQTANAVLMAQLTNLAAPAGVLYQQSGIDYMSLSQTATANVIYNTQNGQPTSVFALTSTTPASTPGQYFTFGMNEVAISTNTVAQDQLSFGLVNSTAGVVATPLFQLNYTATTTGVAGTRNNVTYTASDLSNTISVKAGFRTERGSKVASITAQTDTFSMSKVIDMLQFAVAPSNTTVSGTAYKLYGPYGVGQATNIANVSIGKVTGTATLGAGSQYTITGVDNIVATPSVSTATQPVLLKNLTSTPLVVLDSQANSGSNLILIGSGYVNTLSQQLQQAYNVSMAPTTQIMQAYGTNRVLVAGYYANQTTAAANAFIQQLYAQAASS